MATENPNQRRIWLALGQMLCTLFRLNTGRAWISNLGPNGVTKLENGSVVIKAARSIAIGFAYTNGDPVNGACDLPGFTKIIITPEMVGHTIAVFTSIECKSDKAIKNPEKHATEDQLNWMTQIRNAGGIAGVAVTPEQAVAIIDDWKRSFTAPK